MFKWIEKKIVTSKLKKICEVMTSDCLSEIESLLEKGADVNAKLSQSRTILQEAAQKGYANFIHSLLDRGAIVNSPDVNGKTRTGKRRQQRWIRLYLHQM